MTNKLLQVFLDADLRAGHKGLTEIARKENITVSELKTGQHLVFVNKKVDKIKIFSSKNVVSYLLNKGRLDLNSLNHFTECFGAEGFKYDSALKKILTERLRQVGS